MRKLVRHLGVIFFFVFSFAAVPGSAQSVAEEVLGEWKLDPVGSMEDLGQLARWSSASEAEKDKLQASLERRANEMQLQITEDSVTLRSGQKEAILSCSTRYQSSSLILLGCSTGETPVTITVARLTAETIKLLSSGTDDMDILVWRKAL